MEKMLYHSVDEEIRKNPNYLETIPRDYKLMYLMTKNMRFNNAMDAIKQLSKKHNWSKEEKQKQIDKAIRLSDVANWTKDDIKAAGGKKHKNKQ